MTKVRPKLLPLALLLSATKSRCAHGLVPTAPLTFPRAFVARSARSGSCSRPSVLRRSVVRSLLSNPAEDDGGDDTTFFFRASQLAAQERMQQLKDGREPLAIALSTADRANNAARSEVKTVGSSAEETAEEEIKIPIDPFMKKQLEDLGQREEPKQVETIPKSSQPPSDEFQRKLLESRLRLERQAKSADQIAEDAKTSHESIELDTDAIDDILASSFAIKEDMQTSESDDGTDADTKNVLQASGQQSSSDGEGTADPENTDVETGELGVDATSTTELDVESDADSITAGQSDVVKVTEKTEMKPPAANGRPLSSDGKELFEPTGREVDQQKVEMGLLVLTQGFLTLKSILQTEE